MWINPLILEQIQINYKLNIQNLMFLLLTKRQAQNNFKGSLYHLNQLMHPFLHVYKQQLQHNSLY
jgi:hypothetical protein